MWLLREEICGDEKLRAAIAANWIDALITGFNRGTQHYQEMAALAYELNPDATLRGFVREVTNDNSDYGEIHCLGGFSKCWDGRFTATALDLIRHGTLKPGSIEAILRFTPPIPQDVSVMCARTFLGALSLANPQTMSRRSLY